MNPHVLQLIAQPQLLSEKDIPLINNEIQQAPYMQSLRALLLLATAKFQSENYQQILASTAAYTTDKKILYQLVHGKSVAPTTLIAQSSQNEIMVHEERGIFQTEIIVGKEKDSSQNKIIMNEEKNSLQTETDIIIDEEESSSQNKTAVIKNLDKYEEERLRLIAEVEAKMQARKKQNDFPIPKVIETQEIANETPQHTESTTRESSNLSGFINTWQNWLKMVKPISNSVQEITPIESQKTENNKKEETEKPIKSNLDTIDAFIANPPKNPNLKEESHYEIRERTKDLSHLMTETLAKLYVEQRLYAKAIKAYEVLSKKHPEKAKTYKKTIADIKLMRTQN